MSIKGYATDTRGEGRHPMPSAASSTAALREALMRGSQDFRTRFAGARPVSLPAGKMLPSAAVAQNQVYRLRGGWACQYGELPEDRRAMIDIYLPGDLIGLDAAFKTRPVENVLALTSIEIEAVDAHSLLCEVMASPSAALFAAWFFARRQRRADHLLAAISGCDARGRLALMVLDLYRRLRARKIIASNTFNLPLTQQHIGQYLGLTVVHVNRVLKSLRVDRIVSLERHSLTILDMRRLLDLSRKREVSGFTGNLEPSERPPATHVNIDLSIAASAGARVPASGGWNPQAAEAP